MAMSNSGVVVSSTFDDLAPCRLTLNGGIISLTVDFRLGFSLERDAPASFNGLPIGFDGERREVFPWFESTGDESDTSKS
jgi:hypothetical protein